MKMSNKSCYYCGSTIGASGSKEHVPPSMMFRKGTSSITVYACQKHNQEKSYRDAVIVSFLMRSALKEWRNLRNIAPEVIAAMNEAGATIQRLKKTHPDIPLIFPLPKDLSDLPDLPYLPQSMDIQGWMRQITAGLVYNALKKYDHSMSWDVAGVICPTFVETNTPSFTSREVLSRELAKWDGEIARLKEYLWFDGWQSGPNPYPANIYSFQVSIQPDYLYFKHRFYSTFDWYVRFRASATTVETLKTKLMASKVNVDEQHKDSDSPSSESSQEI